MGENRFHWVAKASLAMRTLQNSLTLQDCLFYSQMGFEEANLHGEACDKRKTLA